MNFNENLVNQNKYSGDAIGAYYQKLEDYKDPIFDDEGVLLIDFSKRKERGINGIHYFPISITQFALRSYDLYLETKEEKYFERFINQCNWLVRRQVIAKKTQQALRALERDYRAGEIYVTTTSKLLNYYHASEYIVWSHQKIGNQTRIKIEYLDDPAFGRQSPTVGQLQGLTFTVPDSHNAVIYLQGIEVQGIQRNPADGAGMESVTMPFNRLSFPY